MQRKPAVPRAKTEKKAEYGPHNSVLVLCHRQKFGLSHSLDRSENRIIDVTQRGEWRDDDHQPIIDEINMPTRCRTAHVRASLMQLTIPITEDGQSAFHSLVSHAVLRWLTLLLAVCGTASAH
jgi:hypothetical protein